MTAVCPQFFFGDRSAVTGALPVIPAPDHSLCLPSEPQRMSTAAEPTPPYVLVEPTFANREAAAAFIQERFTASFDAQIQSFMPELFALQDALGCTVGAFGLRLAGQAPLFLERYMDEPIEQFIGSQMRESVRREHIVEIGQFAGIGPGAFRVMIQLLTKHLHQRGLRWVVFTGTVTLRNAFRRLSLNPVDIVAADPARLSEAEQVHWGRYYEHSPRVLFGDIAQGFAALTRSAVAHESGAQESQA